MDSSEKIPRRFVVAGGDGPVVLEFGEEVLDQMPLLVKVLMVFPLHLAVGKTKRGKGTKWMVLVDGQGLPLGVRLESASPAEVTLAEATLAEVRVPRSQGRPRQKPERVIADAGYDSDPLRQRLKKRAIELVGLLLRRQYCWKSSGDVRRFSCG
jgi:IS5 family transposase